MKVVAVNGSPRKSGNTKTGVGEILRGIRENMPGAEIEEIIDIASYDIAGCVGCQGCFGNDWRCVIKDDAPDLVEKIYEAEIVIFATPIYWWGMTAQLKALIDRMYSKYGVWSKAPQKKIVLLITGGAKVGSPNNGYDLIEQNFRAISQGGVRSWEIAAVRKISTDGSANCLADDKEEMAKLYDTYKELV